MAILAETLVDEWLNRDGYFTVRGIKDGVDEIDILGVCPGENQLAGRHVEVQVSFRPVTYIAPLTSELSTSLGKNSRSAMRRSPDQIESCTRRWVMKKFKSSEKVKARNRAWPGVAWQFTFVHGVVKDERELDWIGKLGIQVIPFNEILCSLCRVSKRGITGAAGTDLAEILAYYEFGIRGNKRS